MQSTAYRINRYSNLAGTCCFLFFAFISHAISLHHRHLFVQASSQSDWFRRQRAMWMKTHNSTTKYKRGTPRMPRTMEKVKELRDTAILTRSKWQQCPHWESREFGIQMRNMWHSHQNILSHTDDLWTMLTWDEALDCAVCNCTISALRNARTLAQNTWTKRRIESNRRWWNTKAVQSINWVACALCCDYNDIMCMGMH